ncbi:hypothetical protein BDW59DRAFT_18564 [Aspergillus cavernicola]|uniref:Uncharacterized protein n=1 Tax=Aspergillus cavernicola TaxID=176166 RepID=A0ABR4IS15_9EURO
MLEGSWKLRVAGATTLPSTSQASLPNPPLARTGNPLVLPTCYTIGYELYGVRTI